MKSDHPNETVAAREQPHLGDLQRPLRARWSLRIIIAGFVALCGWASVSYIDQVTRAQAQIIAVSRTQVVQAPDGGVITEIHVQEGQAVKAGQLLVTLQKARASAAVDDSSAKVAALRITLARLEAEVYGKPLKFDQELLAYPEYLRNQTDLYKKRQTAIQEDLGALRSMLGLAQAELKINSELEATGDVSKAEILRLQRSVADISAQMNNRRNKYFQDAQAEMTKAQEDLNTQTEQLRDRSQLLMQTELSAPADGIVNVVKINTIGAVVRPGDTILELSPTEGGLIAEAKVMPADIGFVAVGQAASVKIDAYDSSIYGAMHGTVSYISPDVLTEETRQGPLVFYRVRIRLDAPEFSGVKAQSIQLRPGLTASVEIKAMERTVLSYLTKPITKTFSESLGER